ncbi:PREDICTED: cytochrome P450 71A1-like [Tarenaya hassleriana]|uniref:cytochrome P450 71A1-like n=1 Tax=Tarenaya hassleriana TaxID=28532 RepID=UPI00053C39F6|nr:PREDICTED: cytochrome P450 71A1-like [Tarenaya hassleriana]
MRRNTTNMEHLFSSSSLNMINFMFLLLILSLLCIKFIIKRAAKTLNLPPSPPTLPLIGNLHQIGPLIHQSLYHLSLKHGPLFLLHLGSFPTLVVQSFEPLQEIIKNHDISFSARPCFYATFLFSYEARDVVFCPYGDAWRQSRKICLLQLLSNKMVKELRLIREEEIDDMISKIDSSITANPKKPVNMNELFYSFAVNVMCRSAAGDKTYGEAYKALVREAQKLAAKFCFEDMFPWLGWMDGLRGYRSDLRRLFERQDRLMEQMMSDQTDKIDGGLKPHRMNFAYVLISLQREGKLDIELDRQNIKGILQSMFSASTDSLPSNMEWAMAELMKHPRVLRKAKEEVRRVVRDKGRVEEEDILEMKYLKCVVKETLRLHGSGIYMRITDKAVKISGYDIPAKSRVIINNWASQRDPRIWKEPQEFMPERFMEGEEYEFQGTNGKYVPFGFGRRICPGLNYAVAMVESVVANLLYLYEWELPEGVTPESMDMSEKYSQTILLKHPLCLIPSKRF